MQFLQLDYPEKIEKHPKDNIRASVQSLPELIAELV
jgi:hypothetical protein